jgi:DNA modification methylase
MSVRILLGDVREKLAELPDESVHCVVTSPPYFGLRDYGTASWEGGDPACDHSTPRSRGDDIKSGDKQGTSAGSRPNTQRECKCGATRIDLQIGLEPTPAEFVAVMVEVFRDVRRVLRKDGTLWLNLGDSYSNAGTRQGGSTGIESPASKVGSGYVPRIEGMKNKDLLGIPWRVAFALQADGWYLRQDIIWSKPNPMPESVTDRCTKAHEYLFLLSKSARYHYDAEAIKEPGCGAPDMNRRHGSSETVQATGVGAYRVGGTETRNKRSVWEVTTQPFKEAHFATFPPDLIEPCIKAGCPKGGTVLDPFGGAGTTGLVADRLQRDAILIELNPEYAAIAERRIKGDAPMFAEVA